MDRPDRGGRLRIAGAFSLSVLTIAALVFTGCRETAQSRFEHVFDSPRALAAAVLAALEAKDRPALESLALSEAEFRDEVFPEMPARGNVPTSYVWGDLRQKSQIELTNILAFHGGQGYSVEGVVFEGGSTAYRTFVVHRKPRLIVRERGTRAEKHLALFGSVIEFQGRYKLFSYVVNR